MENQQDASNGGHGSPQVQVQVQVQQNTAQEEKSAVDKIRDKTREALSMWLGKFIAEFLGTLLLVFVGCMGCVGGWGNGLTHMQLSISFGLVVMFVVQIFGHISGAHVNPAVTLCVLILRAISIPMALVYFVAQMLGAITGYFLLLLVTPDKVLNPGDGDKNFCCTLKNDQINDTQAVIVEIIVTAVLIFVVCACSDPRTSKNTDSVPIKFGLTVAAIAMAAGPYTGGSMNPARSFAPALIAGNWASHWIYWVGPLIGSALATLVYITAFKMPPLKKDKHEEQPLNEFHKAGANNDLA